MCTLGLTILRLAAAKELNKIREQFWFWVQGLGGRAEESSGFRTQGQGRSGVQSSGNRKFRV